MDKISTQNLNLLPAVAGLKQLCKSIAAIEAILCPDWEYRYYSHNSQWSETEECCTMRDGEGDQILILFNQDGAVINGFAHESEMNGWHEAPKERNGSFLKKMFNTEKDEPYFVQKVWPGVIDDLPETFHEFVFGEPVKSIGTTFCIWSISKENDWKIGNIEFPDDDYKDGSEDLLELLDGNPTTYQSWAIDYYELEELNLTVIQQIYKGEPITQAILDELNPDYEDIEQLKADLDEIGYSYTL